MFLFFNFSSWKEYHFFALDILNTISFLIEIFFVKRSDECYPETLSCNILEIFRFAAF